MVQLLCVQSCLILCDPMDSSLPGSSVYEIFQARILEQVAISYSRGSSWPRDRTIISHSSCIGRQILYHWATWEALGFNCVSPKPTCCSPNHQSLRKWTYSEIGFYRGSQIKVSSLGRIPIPYDWRPHKKREIWRHTTHRENPMRKSSQSARFGSTYTKIGTIQRRLAWPLRRMTRKFMKRSIFFHYNILTHIYGI